MEEGPYTKGYRPTGEKDRKEKGAAGASGGTWPCHPLVLALGEPFQASSFHTVRYTFLVCVRARACIPGIGDRTQGLEYTKQVLYH